MAHKLALLHFRLQLNTLAAELPRGNSTGLPYATFSSYRAVPLQSRLLSGLRKAPDIE